MQLEIGVFLPQPLVIRLGVHVPNACRQRQGDRLGRMAGDDGLAPCASVRARSSGNRARLKKAGTPRVPPYSEATRGLPVLSVGLDQRVQDVRSDERLVAEHQDDAR